MKNRLPWLILLLLVGCTTNDFKVVDALQRGMTQKEAQAIIADYGFEKAESLNRPADGWSESEESFTNLSGRAGRIEKEQKVTVEKADYYPVSHGFLGFGQLFLFFDKDGRLIEYYRRQIN